MWDPSINPPISGSGEFIGDYQGLAADDCLAVPFVNDTHLANDPARDPEFDRNLPRSVFQQAIAYQVWNVRAFGGTKPDCVHHRDHGNKPPRGKNPDRGYHRRGHGRRPPKPRALAAVSRAEVRELAAKHQIIIGGDR